MTWFADFGLRHCWDLVRLLWSFSRDTSCSICSVWVSSLSMRNGRSDVCFVFFWLVHVLVSAVMCFCWGISCEAANLYNNVVWVYEASVWFTSRVKLGFTLSVTCFSSNSHIMWVCGFHLCAAVAKGMWTVARVLCEVLTGPLMSKRLILQCGALCGFSRACACVNRTAAQNGVNRVISSKQQRSDIDRLQTEEPLSVYQFCFVILTEDKSASWTHTLMWRQNINERATVPLC